MTNNKHSYKHREAVGGDYVQTLINSLTFEQLKLSLSDLVKRESRAAGHTREAVTEAILTSGQSVEVIKRTLLRVESESPGKHCLLVNVNSNNWSDLSVNSKLPISLIS